jgi:drug/metabolite transporter (DMT)-like permease
MSENLETFMSCLFFSVASVGMVLANKGAILDLKSPLLIVMSQNLISCFFFICLSSMKSGKSSIKHIFLQHLVSWIPAMFLFTINIMTSMLALRFISVATLSVLRSLNPIFSCTLSWYCYGEKNSPSAFISLVAMLIGSTLYAFHDLDFHFTGYAIWFVHVTSMSLYSLVVKHLQHELTPLEMSILNNAMSLPFIALISFCIGELQSSHILEFWARAIHGGHPTSTFFCLSCVFGCFISMG